MKSWSAWSRSSFWRPGCSLGDEARRRFHKEALALAKLSHAHIAAVYDVGEQDGIDYIVMECVPGESLAAKLKPGPLTVKDATSIILQIAEALEEAHEQGVIHRDLKPANVMVTPKGQAKVLDFGLAKLLAVARDPTVSVTETRGLIGTPLYMSPEQAREQNLDARTDLWNLGVIYYELLTGRAPFRADSSIAVLRAITDEAPVPLRQLRPDIPPLCEQIVSHALEKNPDRRYQSATEVIRDASELLSRAEHHVSGSGKAGETSKALSIRRSRGCPSSARSQWASGFTIAHPAGIGRAKKQFRKPGACSLKANRSLPFFFSARPRNTCRRILSSSKSPTRTLPSPRSPRRPPERRSRFRITSRQTLPGTVSVRRPWQISACRRDIFAGRFPSPAAAK